MIFIKDCAPPKINFMIYIKDWAPPTDVEIALKNLYRSPVIITVVVVLAAFAITSTALAVLNDN